MLRQVLVILRRQVVWACARGCLDGQQGCGLHAAVNRHLTLALSCVHITLLNRHERLVCPNIEPWKEHSNNILSLLRTKISLLIISRMKTDHASRGCSKYRMSATYFAILEIRPIRSLCLA